MLPQQRSMVLLRKQGYMVGIVERWIPRINIRKDLFGFADLCAVHHEHGVWFLQVTSASNKSARVTKLLNHPETSLAVLKCLKAGIRIAVWAWGKRGPRGAVKHWQVSVTEITEGMVSSKSHCLLAAELPAQMELLSTKDLAVICRQASALFTQ